MPDFGTIPEEVAIAISAVTFLLGLLIGHSGGSRRTAWRIAFKILFREDIDIPTKTELCDEILEEYKYA